MKAKIIFLLILCSYPISAQAMQTTYEGNAIESGSVQQYYNQQNGREKIYSSSGSLLEYREKQSNGTTKTYNKYHQNAGYYKQEGSKLKYFPKN